MSEVLAKVMRNGIKESLHRGSFVFVNIKGEILSSIGDPLERAFMRSAAKPFQLLSLFKSGAYDRYRFDLKEIAVMTASHNGCLLYTSDAADEEDSVDLGGRRIIKKKKKTNIT